MNKTTSERHSVQNANYVSNEAKMMNKALGNVKPAQAKHFDKGKLRMDLIPIGPLREIAKVLTYGTTKYGDRNWEKGMDYSKMYGSAMRHLTAWWNRENYDDESKICHLSHAACCIMMLIQYHYENPNMDDRPRETPPDYVIEVMGNTARKLPE